MSQLGGSRRIFWTDNFSGLLFEQASSPGLSRKDGEYSARSLL